MVIVVGGNTGLLPRIPLIDVKCTEYFSEFNQKYGAIWLQILDYARVEVQFSSVGLQSVVKIYLKTRLLASEQVFCYESTNRKFYINVIVVVLSMFTCD